MNLLDIFTESQQLSELSTEKLAQYKTAAAADASAADKRGDYARGDKRFRGMVKATNKQFANDLKQGMSENSEEPVGFHVDTELAYQAVMRKFGDVVSQDPESGTMYVPASVWTQVEQVAFDADGRGAEREEGVAEGVTSPEIKQAYNAIMQTTPRSPERRAAIAKYQKLRADAVKNKQQDVAEGSSNTDVKKQISKFEELALAANRAGDDAKCKQYQQKIQALKQKMSQGVAEGSMYGDKPVSWEEGGTRAPTGAFRNPAAEKVAKDSEKIPNKTFKDSQRVDPRTGKKMVQKGVAEDFNPEYDDEAGMANNNLETMRRAVDGLDRLIGPGDNLPEWCQEKIAVAKSMLVTVWDYMESEKPAVAEGSLNELSTELLRKAAQVAKDKSKQSMDPEIHHALGGGYKNPLARHYDTVSQKLDNRAAKQSAITKIKDIASPATRRKMGMGVAEEASPMIKPPANRFDNKQEAFDYAKEHGGKVFKSIYIDPNTGIKNTTFVVKKKQTESQLGEMSQVGGVKPADLYRQIQTFKNPPDAQPKVPQHVQHAIDRVERDPKYTPEQRAEIIQNLISQHTINRKIGEDITVDGRALEAGAIVYNGAIGVGEVLGSDGRTVRVRSWEGRENRLAPSTVRFVANRETQPTLYTWKGRPQVGVLDRLNKRFQERDQALAEQHLAELSFLGSECTKDCSGHRAGYEWSHRKGLRLGNSPYSPSFNKGAALAVAGK